MSTLMPALFLGHGSPENLLLDTPHTRALRALGPRLPRPRAILMVSAHWLTRGSWLTAGERPEQIHDFHGFPDALYGVAYRPAGDPELTRQLLALGEGSLRADAAAGFDHGTWTVLHHLFPAADVPVVQLSLDTGLDRAGHLRLASRLAAVRREGVLVAGSGNIVHNLRRLDWRQRDGAADWARRYDLRVKAQLERNDDEALRLPPAQDDPDARLAVPSEDHFWPLLYIEGMRQPEDRRHWLSETYEYGGIAQRSYLLAPPGTMWPAAS